MGSDRLSCDASHVDVISIHAPAWGATTPADFQGDRAEDFNPRSRMGSDKQQAAWKAEVSKFQSTLPHGERP